MTPIHELLSRIRWDKEFCQGRFELGHFDSHEGAVNWVVLQEVMFPEVDRHTFQLMLNRRAKQPIIYERYRTVRFEQ